MFAVVTNDATIYIYNTRNLSLLYKKHNCHDLPSTSLAFSPNDTMLFSASADKSLKVLPIFQKSKSFAIAFVRPALSFVALRPSERHSG